MLSFQKEELGFEIPSRQPQKSEKQLFLHINSKFSYCPYTIGDDYLQRGHSAKRMDWDTAKKAIDFFTERSRDVPHPAIGFYGGEPLLEADLIVKAVNYCKQRLSGKNITYTMTTNASLLTEELARFFTKENFKLMISLDGPPEIHDRNRRIASNGEGSFHAVYDTIQSLAKKIPGFLSCLDINAVVDPENDITKINSFFSSRLLHVNRIRAALVDPPTRTRLYLSPYYKQKKKEQEVLAMLAVEGYIPQQKLPLIAQNDYSQLKEEIFKLQKQVELSNRMTHGGPCIPGYRKLFVTTSGVFLPCEKCSETSSEMYLGNLEQGFDWNQILSLMNIGKRTEQDCKYCWAIKNCDICAVRVDGIHDPKELHQICKSTRWNLEEKLSRLIAIQEAQEGGIRV